MSHEKVRIFISGFGRIGRSAARIILDDNTLELVGINDLYSYEQMRYLLKYDSVYPTLRQEIRQEDDTLVVNNHPIKLFSEPDPRNLDLASLDVDVVLQCSGMFLTIESNRPFIDSGAKKVIVSTPPADAMPTFIYGVNHKAYNGEPIISNSSCSANAIVPLFSIIDKHFGIRGAMMHMFHSYTAYQSLLDAKHYSKDIRRARAAAVNIIPLESSAARATSYFFPKLEGNLHAKSIRIPVAATTMYDLNIKLDGAYQRDEVKAIVQSEADTSFAGILSATNTPKVSSDYIGDSHSATIDLPLMDLVGGNLLRISAWQDNEHGYACRLVDMARSINL